MWGGSSFEAKNKPIDRLHCPTCSQSGRRDVPLTGVERLTHLHDEALVVATARLGRELVAEAAPLLVQLHHRVLAVLGEDGAVLFRGRKTHSG